MEAGMDKPVTAIMDEQTERSLNEVTARLETILEPLQELSDIQSRLTEIESLLRTLQADIAAIKSKIK